MSEKMIDLAVWPRAQQFKLFRTYQKPHYAVTSRIDVTTLLETHKPQGVSPYRATLFAIGTGLHAIPELCMRFRGETVVQHDKVTLSMTVPTATGTFAYAYVPFARDFRTFDRDSAQRIQAAVTGSLSPNTGQRDDLAYLSCMPWLDYTSTNNALPGPDDCIPRVSWGKFVQDHAGRWSMAMTLEVHHALVDGEQVGRYFQTVQESLDTLKAE